MIEILLPSFSSELVKISATSSQKKADSFHAVEVKDWPGFEKDLKSKAFQKVMIGHDATDSKLTRYVKNFGGQLTSKTIIAYAPSRTEDGKEYKVKVLPSGRIACECKDWQYHHSVRKSDCDHIAAIKSFYRAGLVKKASVSSLSVLGRGMKLQRKFDIAFKARDEGKKSYRELKKTSAVIGQL